MFAGAPACLHFLCHIASFHIQRSAAAQRVGPAHLRPAGQTPLVISGSRSSTLFWATNQAQFDATSAFFRENAAALGLEGCAVTDLDEDGRELLTESFCSRCPDKGTAESNDMSNAWQGEPSVSPPPPLLAGRVVVELNTKEAPKATENFRCLCTGNKGKGRKSGKPLHFKDVRFHRIVKGFVCQGGDIVKGDGSGGDSIYGGAFKDEPAALKLKHDIVGVVSMANSGKNSNTSQFFLTLAPAPKCDGRHVVLGRVIEGLDVLTRIEEEAASADGQPRVQVWVADCGEM